METTQFSETKSSQWTSSALNNTPPLANDFDSSGLRIASLTFTFIAITFICYIFVVIIRYGCRTKSLLGCGEAFAWNKQNRGASVVNSMVLLSATSVLVYVGIEIPLIARPEKPFCAIYHRIKIISFALTLSFIYFALWYRVYSAFYSHSLLKEIINKASRCINFLTLLLLGGMVTSNLGVFLTASPYTTTPHGCSPVQDTEGNKTKWAVLVVCTTTFQVMLLYSFIYPLRIQQQKMLDRGFDVKSSMEIVKRAAITAGVCIASDIVNSAFAIVYKHPTVYANHIIFSCNLLINLVAVVLSASNWQEKLLPCSCSVSSFINSKQNSDTTGSTGLQVNQNYSSATYPQIHPSASKRV